ncbi:MAG: YceI family protein [Streptomycetaceae bacterium]|nr:YceI family protein [Streptomycetaceae bacterium]
MSLPAGAGIVDCRILDSVDQPMPGADVCVLSQDGRCLVSGSTDPYGLFLAVVPAGEYQMAVTANGFAPYRSTVRVEEKGRASVGSVMLDVAPTPALPAPGHWIIDPAHTAIRFIARHVGLCDIHGRFTSFSGTLLVADQLEDSQLDVVIDAESIDTGLAMRDSHLRSADFLDAANYPYLRFTSEQFKYRRGTQWTITGVLNLHGVARTVRLDTDYLGIGTGMEGEARAACKASTELHREDFTLNWQKMLTCGIAAIGSTIRIELDVQAVPQSP